MSQVIDPNKKFNHRWKTDPRFVEGFDYDSPEYADVPDDLKWAIPLNEQQKTPQAKTENKRSDEESKLRVEKELKELRKNSAIQFQRLSVVR